MSIKLLDKDSVQYFYSMQNQLKDHIYKRSQNYFDSAKKTRNSINIPRQLEEYNAAMKDVLLHNLGGIPFDDTPLNARVTSTHQFEDYKIENVIFNSRKNVYVTGSMYIPNGITKPTGAVLFLSGHSDDARAYPAYQTVCDTLAKVGLIVFAIDPPGQLERVSYYDADAGKYVIEPCIYDHDAYGVPTVATGKFLERYFLCDQMRAVDYMLTRPEIDPDKIGVTGNSGGGTQTMAMMAFDDRIAAAAPGTFVTSRESYMYSGNPQDSEQIWYGMTELGYDHISPIMHFAPKPLAILSVNYDFFTIEGTRDTVAEAQRFYDMYGKKDDLHWFRDDYGHAYTPYLAQRAAEFFAKYLLGKDIAVTECNCTLKPESTFYNTKSGKVIGEIPDAVSIHHESNAIAERLLQKRNSLDPEERLSRAAEWLEEKVYSYRSPYDFFLRKLNVIDDGSIVTTPIMWHSQKDLFNFGFMIRPSGSDERELPVIIAIWEDGCSAIDAHEDFIRFKLAQGYQVLVLDVSGMGYIEAANINDGNIRGQYKTLYKLCCDLMYISDSLVALRSHDVLRAIEMLGEVFGKKEQDITLYCCGSHGIYGVIAAFLNQNVNVIYDNVPTSLYDQLIKPWGRAYNNDLPLIMPQMLKYFDIGELMR